MPDTPTSAGQLARATHQLVRKTGARMAGRERGTDPKVRRHSYDVEDPRAKPWVRLGDGSTGEGIAHVEALVATADQLRHEQWREQPQADMRALRAERDPLAAELAALDAVPGSAPVGRRATLRQRLRAIDDALERFDGRLHRIDVAILAALLRPIQFATGQLYPTLEWIAQTAGCHRNTVIKGLRRLKAHGFVRWVRRSITTANERAFAPQREQTSNAYVIEPAKRLVGRARARFLQLVTMKLRRLGRRPGLEGDPDAQPSCDMPTVKDPELAAILARLGTAVANAST